MPAWGGGIAAKLVLTAGGYKEFKIYHPRQKYSYYNALPAQKLYSFGAAKTGAAYSKKDLTIVTYSVEILVELAGIEGWTLVSTGGKLIFDEAQTRAVYETGRGSFKLRARWRYLKEGNLIEIYEIPYTTSTEVIMDKVADLIKAGKIKEIADMRDETDLGGLKLTIDLKRGADPEKLMQKLMRTTSLQDSFACNFNILIEGMPKVMGVREILQEWTAWRTQCVRRRIYFQKQKKAERLHLLKGLERSIFCARIFVIS